MRRRTFLLSSLAAAGLSACAGGSGGSPRKVGSAPPTTIASRTYGDTVLHRGKSADDAPNVLFIALDDTNDWLGFLNDHPGTHTPNLDALAAESLVFSAAYTPAPLCLPARAAVMFGVPPHESQVYEHDQASRDHYTKLRKGRPAIIDPYWAAGYELHGVGKVFHDTQHDRWEDTYKTQGFVSAGARQDDENEGRFDPTWLSPYDGLPIGDGTRSIGGPVDFGPSGRPPTEDPEGLAAGHVVELLRAERTAPFFIGYGLSTTHNPWRLPQQFFDLHPLEEVVVPEFRPDDLDDLGPYAQELSDPNDRFAELYASGKWQAAVQAYQAALSYADWCVGLVLDEVRSSGLADDTIVALWSDHGFHLGEKLHLHKFTLWERAGRVPLLVNAPGQLQPATVDAPVSVLDLGPTLTELTGTDPLPDHRGRSLLPLIDDPALADEHPPVTTWLAGNHAVRRGPWRYIRYRTGEHELYDLENDPGELTNLAGRAEHASVADELDARLPPPSDD